MQTEQLVIQNKLVLTELELAELVRLLEIVQLQKLYLISLLSILQTDPLFLLMNFQQLLIISKHLFVIRTEQSA